MINPSETRSVFAALTGRPNVGKSSLLNAVIGQKVAIVSPKPQTTRTRITGILTRGATQLVFFDTPGLHRPRNELGRYMVKQVGDCVADVDLAVLVTEPGGTLAPAELQLIENFAARRMPAIAVINKLDTLGRDKTPLLAKIEQLAKAYSFAEIIPLSAHTGEGIDTLLTALEGLATPGPHYFDDAQISDQPEKVLAGEMLREKLLRCLSQEIPHGIAIVVERLEERPEQDILDIDVTIYCERASHKGMIIGKGGAMLKTVASQARQELEAFFGLKINLQCWVKVKPGWRANPQFIRSIGYQ